MNLKHTLWSIMTICLLASVSQAQQVQKCGIKDYILQKQKINPHYWDGIERAENQAAKWLKNNKQFLKAGNGPITIPVVVHVVYNENNEDPQNIPMEHIVSQIQVMNEDFRRLNADTVLTREVFDTIATDVEVIFALATTDPQGNPTNGITRTSTSVSSFDIFPFTQGAVDLDNIKHTADGGVDAWDPARYFNIWVGNLTAFGGEGLYGIATFPRNMPSEEVEGQDPAEYLNQGVVIYYKSMGKYHDGNGNWLSEGRTAAHEAGHFFGLRHIWADEGGAFGGPGPCDKDDFVHDTPMSNESSNQTVPCQYDRNSCSNENEFSNGYWGALDPPDMIENFMDYSGEHCQNMFTHGQADRMWSFLETARDSMYEDNDNGYDVGEFQSFGIARLNSCQQDCNGTIDLITANGTAPFTFSLDSGATFSSETHYEGLCQGIYHVIAKDANNEERYYPLFIDSVFVNLQATASATDATCASCEDGEATVTVTSGSEPITIVWNTVPEQQGETATGLAPGDYTATITDACGNETVKNVTVGSVVGVSELEASLFNVYPVPASDVIQLQTNSNKTYQVQILSLEGRVMNTFTLNKEKSLNISQYSAGFYHVKIQDETGATLVKNIVKQ